MNKTRFGFVSFLAAVALVLFCSSFVRGQARRVWVSGVGDDANPCSRTAPCRTFAGAIAKVAAGGEIDVLDSGAYGATVIGKGVTIDGTGAYAGTTSLGAAVFIINAGASGVVVLRNLTIDGLGEGRSGVKFNTGNALYLLGCLIKNFTDYGVDFEPSTGGTLVIGDSTIINNGRETFSRLLIRRGAGGGVLVKSASRFASGTAFVTIDNTRVAGNFIGIDARDSSKVTVSNSTVARNTSVGLLTLSDSNAPAEMSIEHSVVTLNGVGIQSGGCSGAQARGPATVRISGVNVTNNTSQGLLSGCSTPGGGGPAAIISAKNNTVMGNNPDGAPTSTSPQQ